MTRILIVDEDTNVLRLLRIKLEAAGYETVRARDGAEALAAVDKDNPDLIIVEPLLPDSEGRDLIGQIRGRAAAQAPILVLSGKAADEEIATLLAAGASDFIAKPFSPQGLLERIRVNLIRSALVGAAGEAS